MPNLRILYDNAADRVVSITASGVVTGFPATNMQNEYKGKVCRTNTVVSSTRSTSYTLEWASSEVVGGVILPAINLSASSTIRIRLYSDQAGALAPIYDSGVQYACPGSNLEYWNWNFPLNGNAFAFGGVAKVSIWCANSNQYSCRRLVIDLSDTISLATTIDCSRIVCGAYWEPQHNFERSSLNITIADTSTSSRNNAGDLLSDRGIVHDQLSFNFALLPEGDKQELMKIMRSTGSSKNIVVSIFPGENEVSEQDYLIYGKRSNSAVGSTYHKYYSNSLELIGW